MTIYTKPNPSDHTAPAPWPVDTVVQLHLGEWRVRLNGRILPTVWNSRGAAVAGLNTERARANRAP